MASNSLVLLFNVPVPRHGFEWHPNSSLEHVCGVGSGEGQWVRGVVQRHLVDYRVIGVTLYPGYAHNVHAPQVLKCILAIVEPALQDWEMRVGSNANCQKKTAWHDCRVGNIVHVAVNVDPWSLHRVDYDHTLALYELERKLGSEISESVQTSFCTAARAQLEEMKAVGQYNKSLQGDGKIAGFYAIMKEHRMRCTMVLQNLQRLEVNGEARRQDIAVHPLRCPLQLGVTSLVEWRESMDPCKTLKRAVGLEGLLSKGCTCGRVSFKMAKRKEEMLCEAAKHTDVVPMLLHMMKEQCNQRFLKGPIYFSARCVVEKGADGTRRLGASNVAYLHFEEGACAHKYVQQVHNCMIYIYPLSGDVLGDSAAECALKIDEPPFRQEANRMGKTLATMNRGVLVIGKKWQGIGNTLLEVRGDVRDFKEAFIIVGEYSGPEEHAVKILQQNRARLLECPPLRNFFGTHLELEEHDGFHKFDNPFSKICRKDVEAALASLRIALSPDQVKLFNWIAEQEGACLGIRAVAGAGKTTLLSGMVLALVQHRTWTENGCILWLVKSRQMRDAQVELLRHIVGEEHAAMILGIGRPLESSTTWENEISEFDWLSQQNINAKMADLREQFQAKKRELAKVREHVDPYTAAGEKWKRDTEAMHADGLRLFEEQMKNIQALIHNAKILVMTVDGYLQVAAGDTQMSTWMKKVRIASCIVDEAHQLAATLTAPLTMKVEHLLLVWDPAQKITYNRQLADQGQGFHLQDAAEKYPWPFALYGGTFESPWEYLPEKYIFDLTVTWRFGPGACNFLNATCKKYKPTQCNLISPLATPHVYSETERHRVPDTMIRFVVYRKTLYYASMHRGTMEETLHRINAATTEEEEEDTRQVGVTKFRVAGNKCVFASLVHEGLYFLRAVVRGQIRMNKNVEPIQIDERSKTIIATMFYSNDAIVCFQALLWFVHTNKDIQQRYGIENNLDIWKLWRVGTPEALSGADVMLAQVVVIPRNTDTADVRGNLKDEGRRTVAATRGRKLLSFHMDENCFAAVGGNHCWREHWNIVCNQHWQGGFLRQDRIVNADYSEESTGALLDRFLCNDQPGGEATAFQALWHSINDLRQLVHRTRQDAGFIYRWKQAPENAALLEEFLAISEGYIAEIDDLQEQAPGDEDREATKKEAHGETVRQTEDFDAMDEPQRCTQIMQAGNMHKITDAWSMRINLLRSISWYASGEAVQVTPLLLVYHTLDWDAAVYDNIVHFQRLIVFIAVTLWTRESGGNVDYVYCAHKVRMVGKKKIYDCSGSRTAMATINANVESNRNVDWNSYSYVGGGVPSDPPNVYGLVSRYMPHRLAVIYVSVVMLISGGQPQEYMFVRKRKLAFQAEISQHEEHIALERARKVAEVSLYLRKLRETYADANALYTAFFTATPAASSAGRQRSRSPRRVHR